MGVTRVTGVVAGGNDTILQMARSLGDTDPFAFVCGLTPVSLAFGRMLLPCTLVLLARQPAKAYPCLSMHRPNETPKTTRRSQDGSSSALNKAPGGPCHRLPGFDDADAPFTLHTWLAPTSTML